MGPVRIKRIYEAEGVDDGQRVLVDRIWPRGISKARANLAAWLPEVGPSTELRQWFGHEPDRWDEFRTRYRAELADNRHLDDLIAMAEQSPVTLLYSARDAVRNQAVVLAEVLDER